MLFPTGLLSQAPLIAWLSLATPAIANETEGTEAEATAEAALADSLTVYAERAYTRAGEVIENAAVRIQNGKIAGITGGVSAPDGDSTLRAKAMTPGLIDASVRLHVGFRSVEQSTEVQPHRDILHGLDPFSAAWDRQVAGGVTTALVTPLDRNVIGGLAAVVKTQGGANWEARTLRRGGILRGAIGTGPSSSNHPAFGRPNDFYSRRPTTRMGVEWEWRKAFYDTEAARRDASRAFPGSDVLEQVLAGEVTLNIEAWTTQDIRTACYLKEEMSAEGFGEIRLMVDAAAEAWKEPAFLVRTGTSVVLPPFSHGGRTGDGAFMSWNVARVLLDQGVPVALSAHGGARPQDRLPLQAGYAMRGGLSFDEALHAVTLAPATMLGVADRVGSLEVGKDADIVLWTGTPFEPSSSVSGVLLNGELAVDPRAE